VVTLGEMKHIIIRYDKEGKEHTWHPTCLPQADESAPTHIVIPPTKVTPSQGGTICVG
jgi:hypothetical protein